MKKSLVMLFILACTFYMIPSAVSAAPSAKAYEENIYDILVDRFNNGGQVLSEQVDLKDPKAYHGGDLKGIIEKLDDLQSLGFTMLSLSPIMANAPGAYEGYQPVDFKKLEKQFGSMNDLKKLVKEAHKRKMKIMLEFPPSYVSKESNLYKSPDKQDWFKGGTSSSTIKKAPWLENTVVINQDNPDAAAYLMASADFWIDQAGIDGLKIVAADQASHRFLHAFTDHVKQTKPGLILAASTLSGHDAKLIRDQQFDLVENDTVHQAVANTFLKPDQPVSRIYDTWEKSQNKGGLVFVDDKFSKRYTEAFAENGRNTMTVWKLALTYLYTAPGVPIIYQGTEIPMLGKDYPDNQHLVDFNAGDSDMKEFFTRISSLRSQFPALRHGDFSMVGSDNGMSVFKRTYKDETVYIAINNDSESRAVTIDGEDSGGRLRGLLGDNLVGEKNDQYKIGLARETAEVYVIESDKGLNWGFILPIVIIFLAFLFAVIVLSMKQKKHKEEEGA
ncbi:alpha-amylase family glycosyl hydrolase [Virgibacillus halophilus]|uniref:alpha-amylase family glycosyl hydrolase n=1 Tax=Tigheibacillus halophilus TaxID=361280 RepID=UPI003629B95F